MQGEVLLQTKFSSIVYLMQIIVNCSIVKFASIQ